MFIDTHTHLNFESFKNDIDTVIDRAKKAQVDTIINIGTDLQTSKATIKMAEKYPNIYATVGLHPEEGMKEKFNEEEFSRLAKHPKVVAIGETGLDFHRTKNKIDLQKEIFQKHINIANRANKPLVIHSREANDDILSLLISQNLELKGVFHCFPGDWQMAQVVLDLGFYLSFTGLITFSKNYANLDVIKNAPLDRLMIETDCPYLTPEPHRGQRNEPAYVVEVARKIAEIKKISIDEVAKQTTQNAIDLFRLELK